VAAQNLAAAKELAETIGQQKVVVKIKTGEGGKLFGSVSAKEIAEAAKAQTGLELDKKKMQLPESIKALGTYEIPVKLHAQVTAKLTVQVTEE
jgi:large subunit ribosomal protein L9